MIIDIYKAGQEEFSQVPIPSFLSFDEKFPFSFSRLLKRRYVSSDDLEKILQIFPSFHMKNGSTRELHFPLEENDVNPFYRTLRNTAEKIFEVRTRPAFGDYVFLDKIEPFFKYLESFFLDVSENKEGITVITHKHGEASQNWPSGVSKKLVLPPGGYSIEFNSIDRETGTVTGDLHVPHPHTIRIDTIPFVGQVVPEGIPCEQRYILRRRHLEGDIDYTLPFNSLNHQREVEEGLIFPHIFKALSS